MSDGLTVIGELNELNGRLDEASRTLYRNQRELDELQEQIDDFRNDLLTTLLAEYEESDKRLPGEDVRNALITKQLREAEPRLFGRHRSLKAEVKRDERRAKHLQDQISAKQSVLSYLKTEAQAVGA